MTAVSVWILTSTALSLTAVCITVDTEVHKQQCGSSVGSPVDADVRKWLQRDNSVYSPVEAGVHKWQ